MIIWEGSGEVWCGDGSTTGKINYSYNALWNCNKDLIPIHNEPNERGIEENEYDTCRKEHDKSFVKRDMVGAR